MTWFKVDDKFPTHRKVLSIPRGPRRLSAIGAWTLAGAWVSGSSHDGQVPIYVLDDLGITAKVAADLVSAGLWEVADGGYLVHDYLDFNPSKDQVDRDRAAAAERQRKGREKQKSRRDSDVTHTEVTRAVTHPVTVVPTRPDPTPKDTTPAVSARKRATAAPDLFPITEQMSAWGRVNCPLVMDPEAQTRQFLDHHRAKGTTFKDWTAAWRTWMTNAQRFASRDGVRPASANPATAYITEQG
jgi:hypothetical protein